MTLRKLTRIFALIEVSKVTALHGSAKFYSKKSNANSAMPQTVVALTVRIKAVDSIDLGRCWRTDETALGEPPLGARSCCKFGDRNERGRQLRRPYFMMPFGSIVVMWVSE
jgi:hypothetical protein